MENKVGDVLYQLRTKANESQEQVADAVNVSRVAYTRYETNQREPKASAAVRLAQHFGVSVEYLYGFTGENEKSPPATEASGADERERLVNLLMEVPDDRIQEAIDLLSTLQRVRRQ